MVILGENGAKVYRSFDARRASAGRIDTLKVEALVAKGVLMRSPDAGYRFVWRKGPEAYKRVPQVVSPPVARPRAKPSRTLIEVVLKLADKKGKRVYLSAAAARFLRDIEARDRAGAMTMNWSFVAQGKQKKASKAGGMREGQLAAMRALEALGFALGAKDMSFLRAFLIDQRRAKRLGLDFDIATHDVSTVALGHLERLAQAYDRHVASDQMGA